MTKLPLNISTMDKILLNKISKRNNFISINKVNSEKIIPESFYKPISKIINLDEFK